MLDCWLNQQSIGFAVFTQLDERLDILSVGNTNSSISRISHGVTSGELPVYALSQDLWFYQPICHYVEIRHRDKSGGAREGCVAELGIVKNELKAWALVNQFSDLCWYQSQ